MTASVSFFSLAILLTLARRGSSIECQTCYALNSNCTGPIRICDPEFDACESLVVETKTSNKTQKTIRKQCTNSNQCTPGAIFMDLEIGYQESGNKICCTTNHCNTESLTVPTRNKTLNGLRCPFCNAENYETCREEVINCRGWETQCFTRGAGGKRVTTINSVTTVSYKITQKGCATESFCANIHETGLIVSGNSITLGAQTIQCRASSGARIALESTRLCLQALAVLLMTTSFYHCLFGYTP